MPTISDSINMAATPKYYVLSDGENHYLCTTLHSDRRKMKNGDAAIRIAKNMNEAIRRYYGIEPGKVEVQNGVR